MTPVSLSEPSFLKVDAPKAALAATGTAPKGETFGNLIHEATGDAGSEAEGAKIVVAPEGEGAEQDTEGKETALKIAGAAKEGEDDTLGLPPIARLPKGGLTTAKPEAVATAVPTSDKPIRAAAPLSAARDAEGVVNAATDAKPAQQVVTEAAVKGTPQTIAQTGDAPVEATVDAPVEAVQITKAAAVAAPIAAQPEGDTAPETVSADTPESLKAQATREKLATSATPVAAQTAETAKQAETKDAKPVKAAKTSVETVAKAEKLAKSAEAPDVTPEQTVAAQPVEQIKAQPDADVALPDAAQLTAQPVAQDDAQQQAAAITGQAVAPAGQTAQNTAAAQSAPTTAAQLRSAAGQRMASTAPQALQAGTQSAPAASTLSRVQSAASAKSPAVGKPAMTAQAEQTTPALSRTGATPRFTMEMTAVDPMQQALSPEMIMGDSETDTVASLIADKGLPQQATQGQPTAAPMVQVQQSPDSFTMPTGNAERPTLANTELSLEDANWPETMVENFGLEQLADGEAIEIQLTPENMGRVQLRMELRDGQASVMIVTETAEAARQFNDNQQRLSEMMAKAGIELTNHDASAGRQNLGGQGGQGNGNGNANGIAGQNGEDMNQTSTAQKQRDPNRLVDVEA